MSLFNICFHNTITINSERIIVNYSVFRLTEDNLEYQAQKYKLKVKIL